ncbi:hypothetical protein MSG28_005905 [Choristoneura fumiferana]|uniref:Uncharacterized protein n=1 Tax=Choristoneura fumiferana TaxID=7141 RepID=A0ACC0L1Z7_CHOFU|nr:hypothetical protein MSG28_005905 [Choristoneura fumiferana]
MSRLGTSSLEEPLGKFSSSDHELEDKALAGLPLRGPTTSYGGCRQMGGGLFSTAIHLPTDDDYPDLSS